VIYSVFRRASLPVTILLSTIFFRETVSSLQWLGTALSLTGILISLNWKKVKKTTYLKTTYLGILFAGVTMILDPFQLLLRQNINLNFGFIEAVFVSLFFQALFTQFSWIKLKPQKILQNPKLSLFAMSGGFLQFLAMMIIWSGNRAESLGITNLLFKSTVSLLILLVSVLIFKNRENLRRKAFSTIFIIAGIILILV